MKKKQNVNAGEQQQEELREAIMSIIRTEIDYYAGGPTGLQAAADALLSKFTILHRTTKE